MPGVHSVCQGIPCHCMCRPRNTLLQYSSKAEWRRFGYRTCSIASSLALSVSVTRSVTPLKWMLRGLSNASCTTCASTEHFLQPAALLSSHRHCQHTTNLRTGLCSFQSNLLQIREALARGCCGLRCRHSLLWPTMRSSCEQLVRP